MGEFNIKVHKSYRLVCALCDEKIKGEKFEEGEKQLDLSGRFFDGENIDENELKILIKRLGQEDATFFIVGDKSIEFATKTGVISKEGVMKVDNIPFALGLL